MAAVFPLLLAAVGELRRGRGRLVAAELAMDGRRSAATARPSAPSTSRCTTSSARSPGVPVHELRGLSADIPPTDFTIGIDEPAVVAERAARAAAFPALKIKVGGPAGSRDARGRPRGVRRPDPRGCQHRLDARRRRSRSCPTSSDLGVELIEQPFPARRLDQLAGSRSARRCRSSPTRAACPSRTSTGSSASSTGST